MKIPGTFSALDTHLAECIERLSGKRDADLRFAVKLVSRHTAQGNICLDLSTVAGCFPEGGEGCLPSLDEWSASLQSTDVVTGPGGNAPLIFDPPLLYLNRYYMYEASVTSFVRERTGAGIGTIDSVQVGRALELLFPEEEDCGGINWQKVACLVAFSQRVSVIGGGPGTGKTTVVAKVLALCLEMAGDRPVKIMLAAPTGKAAARLQEALAGAKQGLFCSDAVKDKMVAEAMTVHRLLGSGRAGFHYNKDNPLPADIVVVDEASMVDLPLMARLMAAIPGKCRLILLGDRYQLASVQPGAVFGDLCRASREGFSCKFNEFASAAGVAGLPVGPSGGLVDFFVELKQSFRFSEESGIFLVSRAVKEGDGEAALVLLKDEKCKDVCWRDHEGFPADMFSAELLSRIQKHMQYVLEASGPEEALSRMAGFAVLCALRHGPMGSKSINRMASDVLGAGGSWYHGRPVMVSRNHHGRQLYNGDSGLFWAEKSVAEQPQVYFSAGTAVRAFLPQQLPEHETSYAMTVHKSQGSEFDHVLLILPDIPSPVVVSELIYTALTRARKSVEVWGDPALFREAAASRVLRRSGLVKALT